MEGFSSTLIPAGDLLWHAVPEMCSSCRSFLGLKGLKGNSYDHELGRCEPREFGEIHNFSSFRSE